MTSPSDNPAPERQTGEEAAFRAGWAACSVEWMATRATINVDEAWAAWACLTHPQPPADAPSSGAQEALPLSESKITSGLEYFHRQHPTHLHSLPCGKLVKLGETALAAHRLQAALEATKRKLREAEEKATELDRLADELGEPSDPFAAWEALTHLKAELTRLTAALAGAREEERSHIIACFDRIGATWAADAVRTMPDLPSPTSEKAEG